MKQTFTARLNQAAIEEQYERWTRDPAAVDPIWSAFFEGFELGLARESSDGSEGQRVGTVAMDNSWQTRVDSLVYAYRSLGHSIADLDPLGLLKPTHDLLTLKELGFTESDLDRPAASRFYREGRVMPLRQMIYELEKIYCGTIGVEFVHIQNPRIRSWVRDRIENRGEAWMNDAQLHRQILRCILRAEDFEHFLHTRYVGQKRFSLEGGESLMVALDGILQDCEKRGVLEIVMGMAHRGRLNVLANFIGKPFDVIFNEFQGHFIPESVGGNGDVKYHLGYNNTRVLPSGYEVSIRLAANPSHLESVDPVVQGKARARQRILGDTVERKKVLPLLVHGDAAFIGQGVVQEVFNMSQLAGYRTGGTVHIVVNNQIGFTTLPADARSTLYCTDVAKMIEAPIFHVNGDDPIAVYQVAQWALEFRQEFGRDVVIDIYCYRRHGHNEGDEPNFTQPDLYNRIRNHPRVSEIFIKKCLEWGTLSLEEADEIRAEINRELEAAMATVKASHSTEVTLEQQLLGSAAVFQPPYSHEPVHTAISAEMLAHIVKVLTTVPENFRVLPKIQRNLLDRRRQIWQNGGPYDWAFAEALAFASLLLEGTPVRLSGQDSRRGTFSQRHSVLYDAFTRERYIPLNNLSPNQATFCVYNSPLSEYAVLGFDYGYSMDYPSMLCIWEAQFGDFANGAQIIIDQYISSSESKWGQPSSIVLLLPHGYEGQGPEHSSARLERFLQLCAEENMQVCNLTTPAQYFHALRRQIHRGFRKPLIIMTPKSLLRSELAVSRTEDFTNSRFYAIIGPDVPPSSPAERIILCSGKVYYDLLQFQRKHKLETTAPIVRIEQLYPLHSHRIREITQPFEGKDTKIIWCQEEPNNMGAWTFILPRLQQIFQKPILYAGRPESASPAVGTIQAHEAQQEALVREAFAI
ncbi:MAG: 2-oxoglutarate dehydrogenase E1 component [Chthoniobacterales bacterium]|nr:2-oxoglutarate dehydrogenase E1 component [Chthoniobacterales bacterium]